MASFNFQPRFVPHIESGRKTHAIRGYRRNPQKVGKPMYLFRGLRGKGPAYRPRVPGCDGAPNCTAVQSILITRSCDVWISDRPWVSPWALRKPKLWGFVKLAPDEKERLAYHDGFDSFAEMMEFWDGRRPFLGNLNHWGMPEARTLPPLFWVSEQNGARALPGASEDLGGVER
jgi:hypothetical protein